MSSWSVFTTKVVSFNIILLKKLLFVIITDVNVELQFLDRNLE